MVTFIRHPQDPRYIFLVADEDRSGLVKLEKHMNKIPAWQMLPTYTGIPTPEVFLEKFKRNGQWIYWCPAGLWLECREFLKANHIPYDDSTLDRAFKYTDFNLTKEEFAALVDSWNLSIRPREYQLEAAWLILKYRLSLSELATRAGKTLIFYMVARAAKERMGVRRVLMIVPSIHLVKQGVKDLQDYKEYFNCEQIWAEGESVELADLTIGTFQSLVRKADPRYKNYDPAWFNRFDLVCVDEAHKAPCRSIKKILALEAFKNFKFRFGFTGTLPKPNTIEWLACQAVLGPKIQEIKARELIEEGFLADPIIEQYRINYEYRSLVEVENECAEYLLSIYKKDERGRQIYLEHPRMTLQHVKTLPVALETARKRLTPVEYNQYLTGACAKSSKTLLLEQLVTMFSEPRVALMEKIIGSLHKNIIVFAHNTEYIKYLADRFQKTFPDRAVYKIMGATSLKNRQKTLDAMLESDNNILVASYGCAGTGLTFKNVDYGIFAQSFKADTITRQSLGRLMLRTPEKPEFYLYDLIDVYPTGKIKAQGAAKIGIYKKEGHRYEIHEVSTAFSSIYQENSGGMDTL